MRARAIVPFFAFALTTALGRPAIAGDDSGLSDAQTNYKGAIMLKGDDEASFGQVQPGDFSRYHYDQTEYAYWSGNTLYFGAEDENGNGVDAIAEFFWFESSIDRGSDFYVAVIKARTTPNVGNDWYLQTNDTDPVLYLSANTDTSRGTGAFRWDWSVPFENYGMESYGQVNMKSSYGLGLNAEGSAMYAKKYDQDGAQADVNVQAKGYVNADYSVNTNYTVELWSWYMRVRGAPGQMTWEMTCGNFTKDEESAYHEYFLVMQSDEGVPFTIDKLTLGGTLDEWWWTVWNQFSVELDGVTLSRPDSAPVGGEDTGAWDTGAWDTGSGSQGSGDTGADNTDNTDNNGDTGTPVYDTPTRGCSTLPGSAPTFAWMLLPLALVFRRRR